MLQPHELLREGNALMNLGFAIASVGSAALAGLLIGTLGLGAVLIADAVTFVVIAIMLALTTGLPHVEIDRERFLRALPRRAALRTFERRRAYLCSSVRRSPMVLFTLIIPIEVIYATREPRDDRGRLRRC